MAKWRAVRRWKSRCLPAHRNFPQVVRGSACNTNANPDIHVHVEDRVPSEVQLIGSASPSASRSLTAPDAPRAAGVIELVRHQQDAADFFHSIGCEETIQDVSGDGSFLRKQPALSLRYSLNL
jgi:hypothetical protein